MGVQIGCRAVAGDRFVVDGRSIRKTLEVPIGQELHVWVHRSDTVHSRREFQNRNRCNLRTPMIGPLNADGLWSDDPGPNNPDWLQLRRQAKESRRLGENS